MASRQYCSYTAVYGVYIFSKTLDARNHGSRLARSHTTKPPRFHRASTRKASSLHRDEISQPRLALKATGEHPRLGPTFPLPRSAVVGPNGRRRAAVRRGPGRLALLHEHAVVGAPIFEISTGLDKTVFLRG